MKHSIALRWLGPLRAAVLGLGLAWAPTSPALAGDPGPREAGLQPAAALERPSRSGVADALEARIAATLRLEPASRLRALTYAAEVAARDLGSDRASELLTARAVRARWEGLADSLAASEALREDLTRWISDLRFRPRMEASLPPGFPELPTPIHEIEVRSYPAYRMAVADMDGRGDQGAFWKLFQHIQANEVAMTAPVETTYAEEGLDGGPQRMAFLYEGPNQGRTGEAGPVNVVDVPPAQVLSLGVRGNDTASAIADAEAELRRWLDRHQEWRVDGPFRTFGYNSPAVRGLRRCFEVQVPVRLDGLR
jgi:hypothetical protein